MSEHQTLRVMALHALVYCERLYYLEEVEEIRVADERVYAGRTLHEAMEEEGPFVTMGLEDEGLGLRGKLDALRRRDGRLIPYEHKRGRSMRGDSGPEAWETDRVQLGAYALLLEAATGEIVEEGRVRYHADRALVRVPITPALRASVERAISRAAELAGTTERPPVTTSERRCVRCSLAPVCLPEESRAAREPERPVTRLFPIDDDRQPLHVFAHGARVGRRGTELRVEPREGEPTCAPIRRVRSLNVHGYSSVSAQALQLCGAHGVGVHWFSASGWYAGSFYRDDHAVQRRIRQYEALREPGLCLSLARRLVHARAEGQLKYMLRATRGMDREAEGVEDHVSVIRRALGQIPAADSPERLLGLEGQAAAAWFAVLPSLVAPGVDSRLVPRGRSRRPPRDRFNALLSFGYGVLLRELVQAIRAVGLEGAFGFYHRPRTSAPPLALDLMELFRVACVDVPVLGAVNRSHFDADADFRDGGGQVWLSQSGKKKLVSLLERRMHDQWRHPVLRYSLSYRRHVELEVRLLEKEWSGEPGLFARARMR